MRYNLCLIGLTDEEDARFTRLMADAQPTEGQERFMIRRVVSPDQDNPYVPRHDDVALVAAGNPGTASRHYQLFVHADHAEPTVDFGRLPAFDELFAVIDRARSHA
jgi:hypothetical protein